jgi:hypothetical protein
MHAFDLEPDFRIAGLNGLPQIVAQFEASLPG